ncbi:MAG: SLC13 family permease [Clostridia bacterium]
MADLIDTTQEPKSSNKSKLLWLIITILMGLFIWKLPTPTGLPVAGHKLLALLASLIILFIKEIIPLPITMATAGAMLVLFGIGELDQVWSSYANSVVIFVIACLMLANIADHVGLTDRIGKFLLAKFGDNLLKFSLFSCLIFGISSAFMHNVSSITLGLISLVPLMRAADIKPGSNTGKFLVISLAFSCSAGGMGSLAGGGRNLVSVTFLEEFTGETISFLQWMLHALPPAILLIPIIWGSVYLVFKPDKTIKFPKRMIEESKEKKPFSTEEKVTLTLLIFVFAGFMFSDVIDIHYSIIAILGVFIFAALNLVDWKKLNDEVAWAVSLFIFGGGIALGRAMEYTGTANYIADLIFPFFEGKSWIVIFILSGLLGVLLSEFMANVAAASIIVPVAIPIVMQVGVNPAIIALGVSMFTSFAYLLVIGCPPNAIAYSYGYFSTADLFKAGLVAQTTAIIGTVVIALIWWNILGVFI